MTKRELERRLRARGLSRTLACAVASRGWRWRWLAIVAPRVFVYFTLKALR